MGPRQKPERGTRGNGLSDSRSDDVVCDRETEALQAIVRALAREAAREAFERALAEQEQGRLENTQ